MSIHTNEYMNRLIDYCLADEKPTDVCRCWKFSEDTYANLNKKEIKEQFTIFAKHGIFMIQDCNNKTVERKGRTFYMLVVQFKDMDRNADYMCPMSMLGFNMWLNGFAYYFDTRYYRDLAIKTFNEYNTLTPIDENEAV